MRQGFLQRGVVVVVGATLLAGKGLALGDPVSPDRATRHFEQARGMVNAWGSAAFKGEKLPGSFEGAAVQIRMGGELWGRAARWTTGNGPAADEPGVLLERAVRGALASADERLPGAADALRDAKRGAMAPTLTLSVEFAHDLAAMIPQPATLEELDRVLSPGVDGVAVRRVGGAGVVGAAGGIEPVFPGEMAAFNQPASLAARMAISRLLGDPAKAVLPLADLTKQEGVEICTFRTVHIVQTRADGEMRFVRRGDRVVLLTDVARMGEIATMGQGMADHLSRRLGPGGAGAGVYNAAIDRVEPTGEGGALSEMLSIGALVRWSCTELASRPLSPLAAVEMITACAERLPREAACGLDGTFHAAMTLALGDVDRCRGACSPEQARVAKGLSANLMKNAAGLAGSDKERTSPIVLLAGVRCAGVIGEPVRGWRARIAAALASQTPAQLPGAMPFLGLAVMEASQDVGGAGADEQGAAVTALRRLRADLNDHQLRAGTTREAVADLLGGVAFSAASNPLPTWQTARPLVVQARMLGDERYTNLEEIPGETMRVMMGRRFLRQLQCDDRTAWMHPGAATAAGGVRAAGWEQRLPIEATASGLMAVTEALEGLARAERRVRGRAEEGGGAAGER
ncbi:MAG: hypothetical protein ACT4PL_13330 [Phycisphaerales bacterium]